MVLARMWVEENAPKIAAAHAAAYQQARAELIEQAKAEVMAWYQAQKTNPETELPPPLESIAAVDNPPEAAINARAAEIFYENQWAESKRTMKNIGCGILALIMLSAAIAGLVLLFKYFNITLWILAAPVIAFPIWFPLTLWLITLFAPAYRLQEQRRRNKNLT